ncbi:MAG: hypothetical protein J7604_03710 [Sporocytophaga sp.]|uniref:3'(2'),5'-bisphosphate nucleotidase CysQ family protein n=1 Tax=Sporocytophaga sp. TaxID=2231183 RepID=UPI001B0FE38D|nr:inositol monophosphatase family protein [Sporocytophaga sp.]MBO9699288.1 hypothetical protein [Sporocytophaga sp.]
MQPKKIALQDVSYIAEEAGVKIMSIFNNIEDYPYIKNKLAVEETATITSLKSIMRGLRSIHKNVPIFHSQSTKLPFEKTNSLKRFWLVDELNGLKRFSNKKEDFTINIALIERQTPVLGMVYAPAHETLYMASEEGAYKVKEGKKQLLYSSKKLNNLIAIGNKETINNNDNKILKNYPISDFLDIEGPLSFCMIAEGKADIYYCSQQLMDREFAAGSLVLEISGGKIFNEKCQPLVYNKPFIKKQNLICIGNPYVFNPPA